ncbi:hypothetical protein ACVWWN_004889 [Mycobacterium sp. URHB0021]|jgi:hypothetical protein
MERGAERFFAAIPREGSTSRRLEVAAALQSQHPDFLRLFYLLSLERSDDPTVAPVVRRVRDTAIERFRDAIVDLMPGMRHHREPNASSPNSPQSPSRCRAASSSRSISSPIPPTSSACIGGCFRPSRR